MTRDLRKILKMLEEKYPGNIAILIYDDESGRITDDPSKPYDTEPLLYFHSIEELVEHLQ